MKTSRFRIQQLHGAVLSGLTAVQVRSLVQSGLLTPLDLIDQGSGNWRELRRCPSLEPSFAEQPWHQPDVLEAVAALHSSDTRAVGLGIDKLRLCGMHGSAWAVAQFLLAAIRLGDSDHAGVALRRLLLVLRAWSGESTRIGDTLWSRCCVGQSEAVQPDVAVSAILSSDGSPRFQFQILCFMATDPGIMRALAFCLRDGDSQAAVARSALHSVESTTLMRALIMNTPDLEQGRGQDFASSIYLEEWMLRGVLDCDAPDHTEAIDEYTFDREAEASLCIDLGGKVLDSRLLQVLCDWLPIECVQSFELRKIAGGVPQLLALSHKHVCVWNFHARRDSLLYEIDGEELENDEVPLCIDVEMVGCTVSEADVESLQNDRHQSGYFRHVTLDQCPYICDKFLAWIGQKFVDFIKCIGLEWVDDFEHPYLIMRSVGNPVSLECLRGSHLDRLEIRGCVLSPTSFGFTLLPNLRRLEFEGCDLTPLRWGDRSSPNLERLSLLRVILPQAGGVNDECYFWSQAQNLQDISIVESCLRELKTGHLPDSVTALDVSNNPLTSVPLVPNLKSLKLEGSSVSRLDVPVPSVAFEIQTFTASRQLVSIPDGVLDSPPLRRVDLSLAAVESLPESILWNPNLECLNGLNSHTGFSSVCSSPEFEEQPDSAKPENTLHQIDLSNASCAAHSSSINCVVFAEGKSQLLTAGSDHSIRLWDAVEVGDVWTCTESRSFVGHTSPVSSVALTPDGQTVIGSAVDGRVCLWHAATGTPIGEPLKAHSAEALSVAACQDGVVFASAGRDGLMFIREIATARKLVEIEVPEDTFALSIAFSPDGRSIVGGCGDGLVRMWDRRTGALCWTSVGQHQGWVTRVVFSPDGSRVASTGNDGHLCLWASLTGASCGRDESAHVKWASSVVFTSDGTHAVSVGMDAALHVWRMTPEGHLDRVHATANLDGAANDVCLQHDGGLCAIGLDNGRISFIRLDRLLNAAAAVQSSGGAIVGGTSESNQQESSDHHVARALWRLASCEQISLEALTSVAFAQGGREFVAGLGDGGVMRSFVSSSVDGILEASHGSVRRRHTDEVTSLAWSPDGELVASASRDHEVILWDCTVFDDGGPLSGRVVSVLSGHTESVNSVAFSTDGTIVAALSESGLLRFWDVKSQEQVCDPLNVSGGCFAVAPIGSPLGQIFAVGQWDGNISLRDMTTREEVRGPFGGLDSENKRIESILFTADGRCIIAAVGDALCVWDANLGQLIGQPIRTASAIHKIAVSHDGCTVATGDSDGAVTFWDIHSHKQIGETMRGHRSAVSGLAFGRSGDVLISVADDQDAAVWTCQSVAPVAPRSSQLARPDPLVMDSSKALEDLESDELILNIETRVCPAPQTTRAHSTQGSSEFRSARWIALRVNADGDQLPDWCPMLQLVSLHISDYTKADLPDWIAQQAELKSLALTGSKIETIEPSVLRLQQLERFECDSSWLSQLPELDGLPSPFLLSPWPKLRKFDVSNSTLTKLPRWLAQCSNLKSLVLSGSQVSSLSPDILDLPLEEIECGNTRIIELPEAGKVVQSLKGLQLWGCRIKRLPDWIGRCSQLESISLLDCPIEGLPPSLLHCQSLQSFDISPGAPLDDASREVLGQLRQRLIV